MNHQQPIVAGILRGFLPLSLLMLLEEAPRHGLELAALIGEQTGGLWKPSAGTLYIVDTFLVVVFGGAGSLVGTIISAFGIAQFQSILEFFLSGVLAKVYVLLGVMLILTFRPQGLVALKVRK